MVNLGGYVNGIAHRRRRDASVLSAWFCAAARSSAASRRHASREKEDARASSGYHALRGAAPLAVALPRRICASGAKRRRGGMKSGESGGHGEMAHRSGSVMHVAESVISSS